MPKKNQTDKLLEDYILWKSLTGQDLNKPSSEHPQNSSKQSYFLDRPLDYIDEKLSALTYLHYGLISLSFLIIAFIIHSITPSQSPEILFSIAGVAGFFFIPILQLLLTFLYWGLILGGLGALAYYLFAA